MKREKLTHEQQIKYLSLLSAELINEMEPDEYRHYLETLLVAEDAACRCEKCYRVFQHENMHEEHRDLCEECGNAEGRDSKDYADTLLGLQNEDLSGILSGEYQAHVGKTK